MLLRMPAKMYCYVPVVIQWSTVIKQLPQMGNTVWPQQFCEVSEIRRLLAFFRNESIVLAESYGGANIKDASLRY